MRLPLTADEHRARYDQYVKLAGDIYLTTHHVGVALEVLEIGNIHLQTSVELDRKATLMKQRTVFFILFVLLALLVGVSILHAQDVTPTPPSSPLDVIPVGEAGNQLMTALLAIIGSVFSAPLTLLLVSWLKMIPLLDAIPARTLQLLVAVVLVVLTWVTTFFGLTPQFNSLLNALQVAGPVVLQFVLTILGSASAYNYASRHELPIIGYQRPI